VREINHLSIHQWLRSAIRDSQQPTSPIGFLFLNLPPPPSAVLLVSYKIDQYGMSTILAFIQRRLGLAILLQCLAMTGEYAPVANDHGMMFTEGVPNLSSKYHHDSP